MPPICNSELLSYSTPDTQENPTTKFPSRRERVPSVGCRKFLMGLADLRRIAVSCPAREPLLGARKNVSSPDPVRFSRAITLQRMLARRPRLPRSLPPRRISELVLNPPHL